MRSLAEYEQKQDRLQEECPVRAALDVIRGRWKPSILFELKTGSKRFSELQASLPKITGQVLTVQLRQLEADGVVRRTVFPDESPIRVEYCLSQHGAALSCVLDQLEAWGAAYLTRRSRARRS